MDLDELPKNHPRRILAELGKTPELIFDIGVLRGTDWLYQTYPETFHVLVDPLPGVADMLEDPPAQFALENCALGREAGELTLTRQGSRTSAHHRTALSGGPGTRTFTAPVRTFDSLLDQYSKGQSLGVKIDTEGHELAIIEGLNTCLADIQFVICEVSILNRFTDSYTFAELIGAMHERGFRFYNVFNGVKRPAPKFYDCIFLRHDDPLFDQA